MSSQREFSWILPSLASFLLFPQWIYTVSPHRELSRTFSLSGLSFSSLVDTVSPQRVLSRILPSVVFILILLLNP